MRIGKENLLTMRRKGAGKIVRTTVSDFYALIVSESDVIKNVYKIKKYEIMTNIGWIDITKIREDTVKEKITTIITEHFVLDFVPKQLFVDETKKKKKLDKIKKGDFISTELGMEEVLDIIKRNKDVEVYDIKVKMGNPFIYIAGIELAEDDTFSQSLRMNIPTDEPVVIKNGKNK